MTEVSHNRIESEPKILLKTVIKELFQHRLVQDMQYRVFRGLANELYIPVVLCNGAEEPYVAIIACRSYALPAE